MTRTHEMIRGGLFVALAVILPVCFHWFGMAGAIFLPMHIPVLLSGMLAGPRSGFVTGLMSPALSSLLTGMPPLWPVLPVMTAELCLYGGAAGYLRRLGWNRPLSLA